MTPFEALPDEERRELMARGRRRRFRRREVVFHEGDPGNTVHFILSGRVAVRVTTPLGDSATLSVLGRGDAFGELALLDPAARRTATVVALEPTETWSMGNTDLSEARSRHPTVERFFSEMLAAYVRRLSALVLEALYLPVDKRVARRLHHLAGLYATGPGSVEIGLTQDDLASVAGASRPTVNRVLGHLAEQGVISVARGRVVVIDLERLEKAGR